MTKYIERMGTGTGDMIERCRSAGLPEPAFALTDGFVTTLRRRPGRAYESVAGAVTGAVTGEVAKLLVACRGAMTRKELQQALALKGEDNFRKLYLTPTLALGALEMTIPDKPNSRSQKYRLTNKGRALLRPLQPGRKKA